METKTILFVSNCFGEDIVGSLIADELAILCKEKEKKIEIYGASLIGPGKEYEKRGIKLLYSSPLPPSGGFPTKSFKAFIEDLLSGALFNPFRFIRHLSKFKEKIEFSFVIGDFFLLYLTRTVFKNARTFFFSLAKSDYFMPHYKIEKEYLKKHNIITFTRDKLTAKNLIKYGINALYYGNPMMDALVLKNANFKIPEKKRVVGILPGSRKEAYKNLKKILYLVKKFQRDDLYFIAAIPETMDDNRIKEIAASMGFNYKESKPFPEICWGPHTICLTRGIMADVISKSEVVIGLAGTANEQAAGMGKPVISFRGEGPQTTRKRMKEQEKLLGGASRFVESFPEGVIKEVELLLSDEKEAANRGITGKERMGEKGGARNIATYIYNKIFENTQ